MHYLREAHHRQEAGLDRLGQSVPRLDHDGQVRILVSVLGDVSGCYQSLRDVLTGLSALACMEHLKLKNEGCSRSHALACGY